MGMSEEQYWDRDCRLVVAYREASRLRVEKRNEEMWLQGLYIYEALCDVSPIMQAFAKRGAKAKPYPERPFPVTKRQQKKNQNEAQKATARKGKQMMEAFMAATNKKFDQGEGK